MDNRQSGQPQGQVKGGKVELDPARTMAELEERLALCDRRKIEELVIGLYNDLFVDPLSLSQLSEFPNLRSISVFGGKYKAVDLSYLDRCHSLTNFFIMGNNDLASLDLRPLLRAPQIRRIYITQTARYHPARLSDINIDNIGECESLRALHLECRGLTPDLSLIGRCEGLQVLTFHTTHKTFDPRRILSLRNLTHLTILFNVCLTVLLDVVPPPQPPLLLDGTLLLSLPRLQFLELMVSANERKWWAQISLPGFMYPECGLSWPAVNESEHHIMYSNLSSTSWIDTYPILEDYASFFAPVYWPGLNRYIIRRCGINDSMFHIDLPRCVIPSDLLRLIEPKVRVPTTETIRTLLDENIADMVRRYLDAGHPTYGFNIEEIASNEPRLAHFIPRIVDMRKHEIRELSFIQVPPNIEMDLNKWQSANAYYVHPLWETFYGQKLLKERKSLIHMKLLRAHYQLPLSDIKGIEEHLNESGFETSWRYIPIGEYL